MQPCQEMVFSFFYSQKILRHCEFIKSLKQSSQFISKYPTSHLFCTLLDFLYSNWHTGQSVKPTGKSQQIIHTTVSCEPRKSGNLEPQCTPDNLSTTPPSAASSLASPSSHPTSQPQSQAHCEASVLLPFLLRTFATCCGLGELSLSSHAQLRSCCLQEAFPDPRQDRS